MEPFTKLEGVAAPLPLANIDTDQIIPAAHLKTVSRAGLGENLFSAMRRDPSFILNSSPWNDAQVLIALHNFGCGSSREHAAWALLDFGIRCVIAPSFADIFRNNCQKNGILTIALNAPDVAQMIEVVLDPASARICIDLAAQIITLPGLRQWGFLIDEAQKQGLLQGVDEIGRTMAVKHQIQEFEKKWFSRRPWLVLRRSDESLSGLAQAAQ